MKLLSITNIMTSFHTAVIRTQQIGLVIGLVLIRYAKHVGVVLTRYAQRFGIGVRGEDPDVSINK